ncbi:hypothetical protein [Mesorhizobium sp.]|uniref:hypothetical protein n=1 Tax=Mesorhizobium sp. TaxID=1871066 RepID=UPI00121CD105|nr:hypothetical protein [Mesorhizobium sp.]TIN82203.1 MAG: hypothetical protein E5X97_31250 [Mesorhizobium sp.]
MTARASRPEIRNPVLALPAAQRLGDLAPAERAAVEAILRDIAADAATRADYAWRKHKAPMAAYWKAVSVYARHIAIAVSKARARA